MITKILTNEENKINILSKFYTEDEIDNIPFSQKNDKFPTQKDCDQIQMVTNIYY